MTQKDEITDASGRPKQHQWLTGTWKLYNLQGKVNLIKVQPLPITQQSTDKVAALVERIRAYKVIINNQIFGFQLDEAGLHGKAYLSLPHGVSHGCARCLNYKLSLSTWHFHV